MSNTKDSAMYLLKVKEYARGLQSLLSQEFDYKITTVLSSYNELFDRFCPYKIGDRVQLARDPEIPSGWYHSKHFLIKGAIATVQSHDFRDGKFLFGLIFDEESWICADGKMNKVEATRHCVYPFSEDYLELENHE